MTGINCITDLSFDARFCLIDSTYFVERSFNSTESKLARCVTKDDGYIIKAKFDYNDLAYTHQYAIPEGYGMKFWCTANFKADHGRFYSLELCKTNMLPERNLCEILTNSMSPESSVRITTDAPITLLDDIATVRITFWYSKLNAFVAKLKFKFSKTAGDEWFKCYMKYREQIAG